MKKDGFTLLELLVAVGIMIVLASAGVGFYGGVNKRARDTRRTHDIEQLRNALELYRSEYGYYPNVNAGAFGTADNLAAVLVPTYLPNIPKYPKDPTNKNATYQYQSTDASGGRYFGYCMCGLYETLEGSNTCAGVLPALCNYAQKNP